ncbi:hypothetical protein Esi_0060_0056 [Ectocarpus siliculosus]|uniref:Uncharacterized protein n=1 Tax=Ectocarpus siliculosus TaxID=2880 RepID=D8LQS0_ECTSI|nr:hypothetical protein Esi_0060_0056 [Ectocarpus siliculosus]|eukprot:CBN74947.1 hypothetical protein Esi_0060_0056 [Ectocarpus siliculosus]
MLYDFREKKNIFETIIKLGGGKFMMNKRFSFNNQYGVVVWYNEIAKHVVTRLEKDSSYMSSRNGSQVRRRFGKRRMKTLMKWWKGQVDADKKARREEIKSTGASGGKEAKRPRFLTSLRMDALNANPAVNTKQVLNEGFDLGGAFEGGGTKRTRIASSGGGKALNLDGEGGGERKKKKSKSRDGGGGGGSSGVGAPVDLTGDASAGGGKNRKKGEKKKQKVTGSGDGGSGGGSRLVGAPVDLTGEASAGGGKKKERGGGKGTGKGRGKARADANVDGGGDEGCSSEEEEQVTDVSLSPAGEGQSGGGQSGGDESSDSESDSDASSRDGGGRSKSRRKSKKFSPQDTLHVLGKMNQKAAKQREHNFSRFAGVVEKVLCGGGGQGGGGGASSGVADRAAELEIEKRKLALDEKKEAEKQWQQAVASEKAGTEGVTKAMVAAAAQRYFSLT